MGEYRLDDLARVSGVSARNIRAYRERGLLDPPRRIGRSALYDDYHLAQLQTINELLRKGFTSVHIAEFFTSLRDGGDLGELLGIQRAILRPRSDPPDGDRSESPGHAAAKSPPLDIAPDAEEVRQLVECGLAEVTNGAVVFVDPRMGRIVARASDQMLYVRAVLRMFESTRRTVDALAAEVVSALEECVAVRLGPSHMPQHGLMGELTQIVQDYRELGRIVVTDHLDDALQQQMVTSVSNYTAGLALSGEWEQKTS